MGQGARGGSTARPRGPDAAEEPQEEGLGPIVGRVAGGDEARAAPPARPPSATSRASRARACTFGPGRDRRPGATSNATPERARPRPAPASSSAARLVAQPVIDAMGDHLVPDPRAQPGEHVEQRRRVRPARAGAQHEVAALEQPLVADRGARRGAAATAGASGLRVTGARTPCRRSPRSRPSSVGSRCISCGKPSEQRSPSGSNEAQSSRRTPGGSDGPRRGGARRRACIMPGALGAGLRRSSAPSSRRGWSAGTARRSRCA